MNVIEIHNLTKDFGNHKGVFDLSFSLKPGEVVGFLGPNGAGKTTTIRHLMGFIKSEQGSAKIFNMDCFKNASVIQENIGYLPGEITFMDQMTGEAFIHFIADMKNIKDRQYAKELAAYFEVDTKIKIKKMSKGMKQKIGLICFLVQMLSQVSEDIEFLKYVTPLTLFNPEKLAGYEMEAFAGAAALVSGAVLFVAIGVIGFKKRDLSL